MDKNIKEELQSESAKFIADLFKNHNVDCLVEKNEIFFNEEKIEIIVNCFEKSTSSKIKILQLDICINYNLKVIVESFAGLGDTLQAAKNDALFNFSKNSFHVFFSAFFTPEYDDQVIKENWNINGKDFEVILGNVGVRGKYPIDLDNGWLNQFRDEVSKINIEDGVHWLRLFYSQTENNTTVCEVLLDNEIHEEIEKEAENFEWYKQIEFYSLRVFIILKHGNDLGRIAKIIGSNLDYEEIFRTLKKLELSELEIEKAYAFIPEVFGRKFIKDMGLAGNFSNIAVIKNEKEEIEIDLNNEEVYLQSVQLANNLTQNGWNDQLKRIAMTSAPLAALNQALHGGVKLEDITCESFSSIFMIPSYPKIKLKQEKKPFWKIW